MVSSSSFNIFVQKAASAFTPAICPGLGLYLVVVRTPYLYYDEDDMR